MDDETKKEYELFLNSKEVQPSKEISDQVFKDARAHFSKRSTKNRILLFKIKNHLKKIFKR